MQIRGIDHVAVNVKDLEASKSFYTDVLGLSLTDREHQKPGKEYFLKCGNSLIGLIQGDPYGKQHPFEDEGWGANHVAFRVPRDEFDKTVEWLKEKGVTFSFIKKREKSHSAYFEDPDGNKLEITAWPEED